MIKTSLQKTSTVLIACLLFALLPIQSFAVEPGFDNFVYSDNFVDGQFSDVSADDWFARYVRDAVNFGLVNGRSNNIFDPGGLLSLGETVALAARLSSIFRTGEANFERSVPFYAVYADYALSREIIEYHGDYLAPVTRTEFATIMHNALPYEAFAIINDIPDFGIIDVAPDSPSGLSVYALYRAGILTGSDQFGSFFGSSSISRAEACAILVRIADPAMRLNISLPAAIPAESLFTRSADAIFMIETFDQRGRSIRTGSGFFVSAEGLAVTAMHVIQGASSATIELFNGETFEVSGLKAINAYFNLVIIEMDFEKDNLNYLTLADSSLVHAGNRVFAIGSPHDLINSISDGIIAHVNREMGEENMIQFTAPISFGSGGGPVLNALGQVIGIASGSFTYGQNLNLAIPVNLIRELELEDLITLERFYEMQYEI